jgi:hypothetical protein
MLKLDPKRAEENSASDEPMRVQARTLRLLPRYRKSKIETVDPKRVAAKIE